MRIERMLQELRSAEVEELFTVLNRHPLGRYKWPEDNEDCEDGYTKPWVTAYINDGIWHDIEICSIEAFEKNDAKRFRITGLDYAGGSGDPIERDLWPGEVMIGDFADIAAHIPSC